MKKYTKLLVALLLAGAGAFANAADLERSVALNLVDGTADFAPVLEFSAGSQGKTFVDTYSFSVAGSFDADSNVSWLSTGANSGLQLTNFDLYKVGSATPMLKGIQYPQNNLWLFFGNALTAGNYMIKVGGSVLTDEAITYSGNVVLSAVPEADTYAMLLAGFGVLGLLSRRRKHGAA
ncbi:PEP-CTERM sorting domain-containing protein [Rugamonas sp. FT107W]|uniref:PEP-CTERM sorting domain-containing protein n=1 Tax=Duganella vulcania TaxID=2692166 RepID=A0A845HJD9_9BURK|nr:FxDxF family PEP-CTERM protein [Duganella vulcania]MYN17665.1 PEP-CTERM sorting domain-containing protein [Duganella vulcania]